METKTELKSESIANQAGSGIRAKEDNNNIILYLLIGTVGLMVIFSTFQLFQITTLKKDVASLSQKITANAVAVSPSSGNSLDMSSWTEDEKMMYEHHGTLPTRLQSSQPAQPANNMVGGC